MKKITLLLFMFTAFSYAQDKPNGTTLEEYNYMTKGYKIQISSGLDVKKGYVINDLVRRDTGQYVFDFKTFHRSKNGTLAGIILVATSKVWSNVYYLAIPVDNDVLFDDFNSKVELWDEAMTTSYSNVSSRLMSALFNFNWENDRKKLKK
ncbi:hypothetical protein ACM55H_11595 [Flavobacterium sp. ZT3R17]|uniref:hypothetical protein n=1 Tax=Flavobacterium cryoconiti TaxID=3398736 RepID=UPI003A88B4C0